MRKRAILIVFLIAAVSAYGQTWRGHTSGYVFVTFNGNGLNSPNIYTSAYGTDGVTWTNAGGNWTTSIWKDTNAVEAFYLSGQYYAVNACSNDRNGGSCGKWEVGTINDTSGKISTIAMVDWSGSVGSATCFQPGVVRTSTGAPYTADGNVHLVIPCSTTSTLGAMTLYETHAATGNLASWSSPVAFTSFPTVSAYDAKVYYIGSTFYAWYTDAHYIRLASSSTLTGTYTDIHTGDWAGWNPGGSLLLEGPMAYPAPSGSGYVWYLQFENDVDPSSTGAVPIMYYSACNNVDFTVCTWTSKTAYTQDYRYRHGAIIPLVAP